MNSFLLEVDCFFFEEKKFRYDGSCLIIIYFYVQFVLFDGRDKIFFVSWNIFLVPKFY